MELILVTGLSGAGKSRVVDALEDIGFFCVDNMPPKLISTFVQLILSSKDPRDRIAVVTDIRAGLSPQTFDSCIEDLQSAKIRPAMQKADYIVDTSNMSPKDCRERIAALFLDNPSKKMHIHNMSFGFKYGMPTDADLVFDVRCLPNPFYVDELKEHTGLDEAVQTYVLKWDAAQTLLAKLYDLVDFLIPLYEKEGKTQLVIAVGCSGGKHRSVVFAEMLNKHLLQMNLLSSIHHRDMDK